MLAKIISGNTYYQDGRKGYSTFQAVTCKDAGAEHIDILTACL